MVIKIKVFLNNKFKNNNKKLLKIEIHWKDFSLTNKINKK